MEFLRIAGCPNQGRRSAGRGRPVAQGRPVVPNRHAFSEVEAGCSVGQVCEAGTRAGRPDPHFSHLETGPAEQENRSRTGRLSRPAGPRDVFVYRPSIKVLQATVAQAAVRMDEPELIRAAQKGDQRAFEQLVRLYDQNVLRLALNLLRSPEDANDIYQEAFSAGVQEPAHISIRLQLSYLAVPDRDEPVPGCAAETESAARGRYGGGDQRRIFGSHGHGGRRARSTAIRSAS